MGSTYKETNIHWNYFLSIESDFEKSSKYVEFTEENGKTFSIEFGRIIMAATQEIDVIMKKLCLLIDEDSSPKNIGDYRKVITEKLPEFITQEAQIPRYGIIMKPWEEWGDQNKKVDNPINWWKANNKIKHHRSVNLEKANFKNAKDALGALLITTLYYYKLKKEQEEQKRVDWVDLTSKLKPKSQLFILSDKFYESPGEWKSIEW